MRRPYLVVLALALLASLPAAPAGAILPEGFDCGPDDGREQLTADGFELAFEAPATPATGHDVTGLVGGPYPEEVKRQATAHFHFRANLAPFTSGDLVVDLDWEETADLDLDVYDADGELLGGSHAFNPLEGNGERVTVTDIRHCDDLSIEVQTYLGTGGIEAELSVTFTNPGPMFACEEEDPHPACEGREEGEPPARIEDDRTRLYLGGDRPGQVAGLFHYPVATAGAGEEPMRSLLVPERPTGGEPNSYTHLALGNTHQSKNPLQAHFTLDVREGTQITGDLQAVLWVSSRTLQDGGTLNVDLFADSAGPLAETLVARVEVPGESVEAHPTRLVVTFEDLDLQLEQDLTLQVSTLGLVTTGGDEGDPAEAHWTVHYDAVQFPSFVALDLPEGALASS